MWVPMNVRKLSDLRNASPRIPASSLIADLGRLATAFVAYRASLSGLPAPTLKDATGGAALLSRPGTGVKARASGPSERARFVDRHSFTGGPTGLDDAQPRTVVFRVRGETATAAVPPGERPQGHLTIALTVANRSSYFIERCEQMNC